MALSTSTQIADPGRRVSARRRCLAGAIALAALATAIGLLAGACSDLDFFDRGERPPEPPPLEMEGFVFHRYADNVEIQRVAGALAHYLQKEARIEFEDVQAFFYEGREPYCQMAMLRSKQATLYLTDDYSTSPPLHRKHDIDFSGDVAFLHRQGYRLRADQMRYLNEAQLLTSDQVTTTVAITTDSVMQDAARSFTLHLGATAFELEKRHGVLSQISRERATALHDEVEGQIAAVAWSCGPDDAPAPPVEEVLKQHEQEKRLKEEQKRAREVATTTTTLAARHGAETPTLAAGPDKPADSGTQPHESEKTQ